MQSEYLAYCEFDIKDVKGRCRLIKFGGWKAEFNKNFPQKVASAISSDLEIIGATYKPVAYLGVQDNVNGTNYAVLAEQTVLCGKDAKNAVMMVFNTKHNSNDVSLSDIRRIVETGGELGGAQVEITLDIPEAAQKAFNAAIAGWTGTNVKPVAYLGQQMTKGMDYFMIAEVTHPVVELAIITVNEMDKTVRFENLFEKGSVEEQAFEYTVCKGKKK